MKDYLIWLKSGETISGTANENTIEWLQNRFKNREYELEEIISFDDEDGTVFLDMNKVEAIAINKCCEDRKAGF